MPARPPSDVGLRSARRAPAAPAAPGLLHGEADDVRHAAVAGLREHDPHRAPGGERPGRSASASMTTPRRSPGLGGPPDHLGGQRHRAGAAPSRRAGARPRRWGRRPRSACRERARPRARAGEVDDLARPAAVAVVAAYLVVAVDDLERRHGRVGRVGEASPAARSRCASARFAKDFQMSAGNVPPATGSPSNSVSIGSSLSG